MWPRWLCVVVCGFALVPTGCFWFNTSPKQVAGKTFANVTPPAGEYDVVFETRLVEQPADDPYLSRDIWTERTDPLPHQLSALLASNGLRIGVFTGQLPSDLDRLSRSEGAVITPMQRRGMFGKSKIVPVNGPLDILTADVTDSLTSDSRQLKFSAAECGLVVTGTSAPHGQVIVRCEFQVQHGDKRAWWIPTAEGGFDHSHERTRESFSSLAFELTLAADDTLVIGPTAQPEATLGGAYFVTADQAKRRVMLIRASTDR